MIDQTAIYVSTPRATVRVENTLTFAPTATLAHDVIVVPGTGDHEVNGVTYPKLNRAQRRAKRFGK